MDAAYPYSKLLNSVLMISFLGFMEERKRVIVIAFVVVVCAILLSGYIIVEHILFVENRDEVSGELVSVSWEANTVFPPDTFSRTQSFEVHGDFSLTYDLELPSSDLEDVNVLNGTLHFDPLVTIGLRDPLDQVVWNCSFNSTVNAGLIFSDPPEGGWTLRVEAMAYGGDQLWGMEWHDRVRIVVETV